MRDRWNLVLLNRLVYALVSFINVDDLSRLGFFVLFEMNDYCRELINLDTSFTC